MNEKIPAFPIIAVRLMITPMLILSVSETNLKKFISALTDGTFRYPRTGRYLLFLSPYHKNRMCPVAIGIILPGVIADGNDLEKLYR